jgi:hypothetical protein
MGLFEFYISHFIFAKRKETTDFYILQLKNLEALVPMAWVSY